jgi:hypothetical protein
MRQLREDTSAADINSQQVHRSGNVRLLKNDIQDIMQIRSLMWKGIISSVYKCHR